MRTCCRLAPPTGSLVQARDVRLLRQEIVHKAHIFWKDNNELFAREKATFEASTSVGSMCLFLIND